MLNIYGVPRAEPHTVQVIFGVNPLITFEVIGQNVI